MNGPARIHNIFGILWTNSRVVWMLFLFFKSPHDASYFWVMHFLQETGSLSQKCMTDHFHDSSYLPHLVLLPIDVFSCPQIHTMYADARSSYVTHRDKISPQNATVICENEKPKWVWIIWMSHYSQEVWDIWPVTDLCSSDVLTSGLQSCTVILRLSTTLPVCTVSEIVMHALRSAKEIGYTGQVSRAGVHLGGDRSQDLCLIPLKSFVSFFTQRFVETQPLGATSSIPRSRWWIVG